MRSNDMMLNRWIGVQVMRRRPGEGTKPKSGRLDMERDNRYKSGGSAVKSVKTKHVEIHQLNHSKSSTKQSNFLHSFSLPFTSTRPELPSNRFETP